MNIKNLALVLKTKKNILLLGVTVFLLVLFSFVGIFSTRASTQCYSDSDCTLIEFCEFQNCASEDESGICVRKPDTSSCDIPEFAVTGPVCGCDGVTYQNDCYRQVAGVSKNYKGECIEQITAYSCSTHFDCAHLVGLKCINFPEIGKRCAEPDVCSYFDCLNQLAGGFCTMRDLPVYYEVLCAGDCQSDEDCKGNEFCDFQPCDSGAGYCTEILAECLSEYSPVCGCDGRTYQNDCLRKKAEVSKNYNGECIDKISNTSCDIDDMQKDTCNFIGGCFEFPGIGRRCAARDPLSYYPCPEGFEGFVQLTYPQEIICKKNCSSDDECGSTSYVEYSCLLREECDGAVSSTGCCDGIKGSCLPRIIPCPDYYKPVCGCDGITYKNNCFLMEAGTVKKYHGECIEGIDITDITCDAMNPCPEGLDLGCYSFPGTGSRCARKNPCSYYECPEGTECGLTASYPGQVICSTMSDGDDDDEGMVTYDALTGKVEFFKAGKSQFQDVSIHTGGGRVMLETPTISAQVECSQELVIEESKLLMITSDGKKPINISPADAVEVSGTPDQKAIKEIELKEEAKKPIYLIQGTKRAKLFFLIPVSMKIESKIDAGSGKVLAVKKPWWSFLAR